MKDFIETSLEKGPVTYLDISYENNMEVSTAKACLIDYLIENTNSVNAMMEICIASKGILICKYVTFPPDLSLLKSQGKIISLTVSAIYKKTDALSMDSFINCMSKYNPKVEHQEIKMNDYSPIPIIKTEKVKSPKKEIVTTTKKKFGAPKQAKLESLNFVSKTGAENKKPKRIVDDEDLSDVEMTKEKSHKNIDPEESHKIKSPAKPSSKIKRPHEELSDSEEESPHKKIAKIESDKSDDKSEDKSDDKLDDKLNDKSDNKSDNEKNSDKNQDPVDYIEVKRTKSELITVHTQDNDGYLISENKYVTVEYTEKVKKPSLKTIVEHKKPPETKKIKKNKGQMSINDFFK